MQPLGFTTPGRRREYGRKPGDRPCHFTPLLGIWEARHPSDFKLLRGPPRGADPMKIMTTIMIATLAGCADEVENKQHELPTNSSMLSLEVATLHAGALSNFTVSGAESNEMVTLYGSARR